nr:CHASE2 domain-containing protein [Leptolyngbyaceae cyanobacterium MAG.088]
ALHYLKAEDIQLETLDDDHLRLGTTTLTPLETHSGGYQGINAHGFQMLLSYNRGNIAKRVTLSALLKRNLELDTLENYAVVIGMSDPSAITDYFLTPLGVRQWPQNTVPGIDIHAQIIQYLVAVALNEQSLLTSAPIWADWLWIASWALIGCMLTLKRQGWPIWLISLGISMLALYGLSWLLFTMGIWVPLVPGAMALLGASGLAALPRKVITHGQAVTE